MTRFSKFHPVHLAEKVARLQWSHAASLLAAVFALANWQLILGQAHEKWDAYALASPYFSILAKSIRSGELLLWNPYIAAGSPDFAAPGGGSFSPDLLLFVGLTGGSPQSYIYYWLLVWVIGGLGILLLGRQLGAPAWLGLTVALGYVFSGFYTGHAEHLSVLYSHSLLPLVIWRLDVSLSKGRLFAAVQAGVLLGLSGLTGYPALTVGTAAVVTCWAVGRALIVKEHRVPIFRAAYSVAIIAFVSFLVLLPSLFAATYEAKGYTDRSAPLAREFALSSNALHPAALASLSTPAMAALKLVTPSLCAYTDVSCLSLYTGSATLLLAAIALTATKQRAARWTIFFCGIAAALAAMSYALPLRGWLYDAVPLTQYFRHSGMLRGYFLFSLSVLALLSFPRTAHTFSAEDAARSLKRAACAIGSINMLVFVALFRTSAQNYSAIPGASLHALIVWLAPIGAFWFIIRNPHRIRVVPAILVCLAVVDACGSYYLSRDTIRDPGARPPITDSTSTGAGGNATAFGREIGTSSGNFNLLSSTPTFKSYAPLKNRFYELTATYPELGFIAIGKDRIWFAQDVPEIGMSRSTFEEFHRRVTIVDQPFFVRHSRETMMGEYSAAQGDFTALQEAPTPRRVDALISTYTPRHLVLDLTAPADGWVMLTERWARSWYCLVNGVEQPISGANFIFRALKVNKGTTHIELSYEPPHIFGLVALSWTIVAMVLVFSFAKSRAYLPLTANWLHSLRWFPVGPAGFLAGGLREPAKQTYRLPLASNTINK